MKLNKLFLVLVLLFGMLMFVSSAYTLTNVRTGSAFSEDLTDTSFDSSVCRDGQDFIVQVAPLECEPAVVRSDLLEEQDVPVFCKLQAIKINPFIDVTSINSISIKGEYPGEIKSVGFTPAYSALGGNVKLNSLQWDDIGYATIVLRQNTNESAMPDFVTANLSAKLTYDLKDAFGLRKHTFYLPVMTDGEFDRNSGYYSFFNKMGYLRAEDVTDDSASIAVYSGSYDSIFGLNGNDVNRERIGRYNLNLGQETSDIYLSGFDCFSSVQFRLEDIEFQDTRVRFSVNSQTFEVQENERFLDNNCYVRNVEKAGLNEIVGVTCQEDDGTDVFQLRISPKVKLEINGVVGEYEVGDYLFETDESKYAYLAYVGSESYEEKDLMAYVVFADEKMPQLGESEILAAGKLGELNPSDKSLSKYAKYVSGSSIKFYKWIMDGASFKKLNYGSSLILGGAKLNILGFGEEEDYVISSEIESYYNKALDDYDYIFSNYQGEVYPESDDVSLGEKALYAKIILAKNISQKKDMKFFCDEFESNFPDSDLDISFCDDLIFLSNVGVSTRDVMIDGEVKTISFEGIYQPSFDDYGVTLYVRKSGGDIESYNLRKEQTLYLDDAGEEYVQLVSINDEDSATFKFNVKDKTTLGQVQDFFVSENRNLKKDVSETYGDYTFILNDVNFERVAKVTVNPSVSYAGSDVDFGVSVGIEKRRIQLSPEMTDTRIDKLNKTMETWKTISSNLDNVVNRLQQSCLAVGGLLTLKNLLFNSGGQAIARQDVMSGTDGWYERCADLIADGRYSSEEECLQDNADAIDGEVDLLTEMLNAQNNKIKSIQSSDLVSQSSGLLGNTVVNTTKLVEEYLPVVKASLEKRGSVILDPTGKRDGISVSSLDEILTVDGWNNGLFTLDLLKEIELYANVLNGGDLSLESVQYVSYEAKLFESVTQLVKNSEKYLELNNWARNIGTSSSNIDFVKIGGNVQELAYDGLRVGDLNVNLVGDDITKSSYVKLLQGSDGRKYILVLDTSSGTATLPILRDSNFGYYIYDGNGNRLKTNEIPNEIRNIYCRVYDASSYKNTYKNAEVTYYETEPYEGLPAVVPFDISDGWYAYVEQSIEFLNSEGSYDASGRVNSFWLCNVGENGLQEFSRGNTGDDICQLINLNTGQAYNQFSGLKSEEAARLVDEAVNAIEYASRSYKDGVKSVKIGSQTIEVGSPAVSTALTKCTDYMSPKDCKILFNTCDPVICPPSRCDFGGQYAVQDVVQSGIIGSLLLCLPNYKEGIYAPVCLTGVNEGVKAYLSVMDSYKSCLQESLDTGSTVGVCDQINSIYVCEFMWKQAVPLAKMSLPKIIGAITGENTRGGGEYSRFDTAWENAKNSASFFTEFYAASAFSAFKARSQENIGSDLCKSFISVNYPAGQGVLDTLTVSDSPPQYTGSFEEMSFTSATVPPISQYKVFYHIYAGENSGAYYKVYLRGGTGSSYYQDTASGRLVDSGYIAAGGYATDTVDFTAPEGYQQLCIAVNDEEECGFSRVSTSFVSDYLGDRAVQSQIENTDIKTQNACVSGSLDIYGLLNLNVQEGVSDFVDPEIYTKGIIRTCGTDNPGLGSDPYYGTDNQRWVDVGYCGDTGVRCWIDTDSIDDALEFETSSDESLGVLGDRVDELLQSEGGFLSSEDFAKAVVNLSDEEDRGEKFAMVQDLFDKVYLNSHKGYLYYLRGSIYGDIVRELYDDLRFKEESDVSINISDVSGGSCEYVVPFDEVDTLANAREKVLKAAELLNGTPALKGSVIGDYDRSGAVNCFDSVLHVYNKAGVTISGGCVYSDKKGKEYSVGTKNVQMGVTKNSAGGVIFLINEKSCENVGLSEDAKLDLLGPGDLLSIVYSANYGHSVIFIDWVDKKKRTAKIFDWINKDADGNRVFGYRVIDLSDGDYSVYMFWQPQLSGSSGVSNWGVDEGKSEIVQSVQEENSVETSNVGDSTEKVTIFYYRGFFRASSYPAVDTTTFKKFEVNLADTKFVKDFEGNLYSSTDKTENTFDGDWNLAEGDEKMAYTNGEDYLSSELRITWDRGATIKSYPLVDVDTYKRFEYGGQDTKFVKDYNGNLYYSIDGGVSWKRTEFSSVIQTYDGQS